MNFLFLSQQKIFKVFSCINFVKEKMDGHIKKNSLLILIFFKVTSFCYILSLIYYFAFLNYAIIF